MEVSAGFPQFDHFLWVQKENTPWFLRIASSRMLRSVAHVRTDVSEELSASFIRVTRIRATRRNIPEDDILHSHRRENLKSVAFSSQANYTD
jgi:hypothetical protein